MAEVITGDLIDFSFEEKKVKVGEKLYPMTADAAKFCRVCGILKKTPVDIRINDRGEVCDIRPQKDPQQQAPAQQQGNISEKRTSPEKPAAAAPPAAAKNGNPVTLMAAVESVDVQKRFAKVVDEAGVIHILKWTREYLDEKMGKLKAGYYRGFTGEIQGDDLVVTAVQWVEKTDIPAWVGQRFRSSGGRGGGGYSRNDKAIMLQCLFKGAIELKKAEIPLTGKIDLKAALKECRQAAETELADFCKAGGVA